MGLAAADRRPPVEARSWWRARIVLSLLLGCASLPDARETGPAAEREQAAAERADHPLPSDAQLRKAVGDGADLEFIREAARIEAAIARRPLLPGNSVRLLKDGPAAHGAQLEAIRAARHSVHLMTYLLTDERVGQDYAAALIERAQRGVKVRVVVDGMGAKDVAAAYRERLAKAGVEFREFNSVNPLKEPRLWRITRRNHRKMLVVDGRVAFTGGINITDDYLGSSGGGSGKRGGSAIGSGSGAGSRFASRSQRGWRDTQVQVRGPAVAQFQKTFLDYWAQLGAPAPDDPQLYPALAESGSQFVRLVVDNGQDLLQGLVAPAGGLLGRLRGRHPADETRIYATYLSAIQAARSRVWITQAYFAPNDEFIAALQAAAQRGVDVRLLMPGESDVPLLLHAGRSYFACLLDAGIRLYEYQDTTVLHAKTAVIDGVWATVGSSNLDYRSFIVNDEANAIIIGREFGQQMERMFEDDLRSAREITRAQWQQRPWRDRLREKGAAAFRFLL